MDNLNFDVFYSSLKICLFCVSSGLVLGFILKFLLFCIFSIWTMFRNVTGNGRG